LARGSRTPRRKRESHEASRTLCEKNEKEKSFTKGGTREKLCRRETSVAHISERRELGDGNEKLVTKFSPILSRSTEK